MPTYEYQCGACGHQMEAFQKMSDEPLTLCPTCHKPTLNKLISGGGFQLKGSGWYVTDYSKKSKPSQESKTESGTSGGGESKPSDTSSKKSSSESS